MRRMKALALLGFLTGLTFLLQGVLFAEPSAPEAPMLAPGWLGITAITNDTFSPSGAEEPNLAIAPDGSKMTIAYLNLGATSNDANPYYRQSTSANWDAWLPPAPIHLSSPVARSFQLDITHDSGGTAHAVWRDQTIPQPNTQLVYKKGSFWGANSSNHKVITATNALISSSGASAPSIAATSASTLDIVWSEDVIPNTSNILYSRSINGGTSWSSPKAIAITGGDAVVPSLEVGQTGLLHVVWEQSVFIPFPVNALRSFIYYSSGTPAGGTAVNWTPPITISKGTTNDKSRYPEIVVAGSTLYVSYTHWQDNLRSQEKAHLVGCSRQCTASPGNWSLAAVSSQFVDFNLTPNDSIVTSATYGNGCAYVHYDGIPSGALTNEIIWGLSSCDAAPDTITLPGVQSIIPSTAVYGEWVHLAYERKGTGNRHIYYVRGKLPYYVYLPSILRGG